MYKKYLLPLALILALAMGIYWSKPLLKGEIGNALIILIRSGLLFGFGLSLNVGKKRRYETWLRKVIISFVFIFFLIWDLGYIMIPELKAVFNSLGINGYIVYLIYIYCGWSFFD